MISSDKIKVITGSKPDFSCISVYNLLIQAKEWAAINYDIEIFSASGAAHGAAKFEYKQFTYEFAGEDEIEAVLGDNGAIEWIFANLYYKRQIFTGKALED